MVNGLNLFRIMHNPQAFFDALSKNEKAMENPMVKSAVEGVQKKDGKSLENLARNMYKNAGIDIEEKMGELKKQMGIN